LEHSEDLYVQEKPVDSINEYYVAMALDELGFEYQYQKYVGIPGVRGLIIIDFLVYTIPKPTPLFVHGTYWHTGKKKAESEFQIAALNQRMRGTWAEAVIIWENECESVEDAKNALRDKL
jgi:hypothetical protein